MAETPTPKIGTPEKGGIEARTLMIGITLDGKSKAWPQHSVRPPACGSTNWPACRCCW